VEKMIRIKKKYGVIHICEIYYESVDVVLDVLKSKSFLSARIYAYETLNVPKGYLLTRVKKTTRIVLEDKSKEGILSSFRKNYRNEIRKTYANNRYSFSITEGLSDEGYNLYKEFEVQSNRQAISKCETTGIWALGYIGGEVVSGVYMINVYPVLKIISIFSTRKRENKSNATEIGYVSKRLMYEICCFARDQNFHYVDLAYINTEDELKAGITAYKLGFGGDIISEYLYEKDSKTIRFLKFLKKKIGV